MESTKGGWMEISVRRAREIKKERDDRGGRIEGKEGNTYLAKYTAKTI